jgi:uncharacterized phage protein (TIGR02220 family)
MTVEEIMAAINSADSLDDLKRAIADDIPVCLDSMVRVLDHLIAKTGRQFKSMKKIESRMREGFTPDELMLIIDWKVHDWASDAKMRNFIRPETIFRSKDKADGYLSEAVYWQSEKTAKEAAKNEAKSRMGRAIVPNMGDS